jgi:tripartite-type tricarboxylate transporter receptor subunit TctC
MHQSTHGHTVTAVVKKYAAALTAITLGGLCAPAVAAGNYPDHPITLITPYSAGGDSDIAARNFGAVAQKYLGQPVVVMNKPGASGVIGSDIGRTSPPDGYTLVLSRPGSQAILPAISPTKTKYHWNDFTVIGLLELTPYGCFVKGKSKYHSFDDLQKALKDHGKQMNYATSGALTTNAMGPRVLFNVLKLGQNTPTAIPYKGTGETITALMGDQVDFTCSSLGPAYGLVKEGSLRALFVTTPERLKNLPDVPTAKELGLGDMGQILGWSGLSGPPGMPKEVVQKLWEVMQQTAKDPQWSTAVENSGSVPHMRGPDEAQAFTQKQYQVYRDLGESLDIIDKVQ